MHGSPLQVGTGGRDECCPYHRPGDGSRQKRDVHPFRKSSRLCAYRVGLALIATNWNSQIRELIQVMNTRGDLRRIEIADRSRGGIRLKAVVDQRDGRASYGAKLDRDYIVEDPASVRESCKVASQYPKNVGLGRGRDGHVQAYQIRRLFPREILESRNDARGDAGEQNGLQIHTVFLI